MTQYFVDGSGVYIGGFDGSEPPSGSIEVSGPPEHGIDTWDGANWITRPATIDDVKEEAHRRIIGKYSTYSQLNKIAQGVELNDKRANGETLTPGEETIRTNLLADQAWIKSVRDISDIIELELGTMTKDEMTTDIRWPQ